MPTPFVHPPVGPYPENPCRPQWELPASTHHPHLDLFLLSFLVFALACGLAFLSAVSVTLHALGHPDSSIYLFSASHETHTKLFFLSLPSYSFIYLAEIESEQEIILCSGVLLKRLEQPGLGQAEARSQESMHMSHSLLPPSMHSDRGSCMKTKSARI